MLNLRRTNGFSKIRQKGPNNEQIHISLGNIKIQIQGKIIDVPISLKGIQSTEQTYLPWRGLNLKLNRIPLPPKKKHQVPQQPLKKVC